MALDKANIVEQLSNATVIEIADLVTEMRDIKHPFKEGIVAQKGIEF